MHGAAAIEQHVDAFLDRLGPPRAVRIGGALPGQHQLEQRYAAMGNGRRLDDRGDRAAQVAAALREHGVERVQVGEVDPARHQHRVVDPDALHAAHLHRPELRRDAVAQRLPRREVDRVARGDARRHLHRVVARQRLERRIDPRVQRGPEPADHLLVFPARSDGLRGRDLAA